MELLWLGDSFTVRLILPLSGVYLTALPIIFTSACCKRRLSPVKFSCSISKICTCKLCLCFLICGCTITSRLFISSGRLKQFSLRLILPDSIRLISSTSLIRPSRWRLEASILPSESLTRSLSSICAVAIAVIPIIAFIGVRMSCDILDKKSDFALLAMLAASKASLSALCCLISSLVILSTQRKPSTILFSSVPEFIYTKCISKYSRFLESGFAWYLTVKSFSSLKCSISAVLSESLVILSLYSGSTELSI